MLKMRIAVISRQDIGIKFGFITMVNNGLMTGVGLSAKNQALGFFGKNK